MKKIIDMFYEVKNQLVKDINQILDPTGADRERYEVLNKRLQDVNQSIKDEQNLWFDRYDYPEGSFDYYLQAFKYLVRTPADIDNIYVKLVANLKKFQTADPLEKERYMYNIIKAKEAYMEPPILKDLLKKSPGMPLVHEVKLTPEQLNSKVVNFKSQAKEGNTYELHVQLDNEDQSIEIPMMRNSFIPKNIKNQVIDKAASNDQDNDFTMQRNDMQNER